MSDIRRVLKQRQDELARKEAENGLLKRQMAELEKRMMKMVETLTIAQESLNFLQDLANSRRGHMKGRMEKVVTEAVQLIYGPEYKVELSYSTKNNRSNMEIEMVRVTPAGEIRRDMDGFGGGMADTISVPLRLMVLMGSKKTDKVCALDECWKHIDTARVELVGKFVRTLVDKLGIQILFVSHHDVMTDFADKAFRISLTDTDAASKVENL